MRFCRNGALLAVCLLAIAPESHATDIFWIGGNGTFSTVSEWADIPLQPDRAPGPNDVAHFGTPDGGLFGLIYTVNFTTNPTNQAFVVADDAVTFDLNFDLNTHVYILTSTNPITIGTSSNRAGQLTIREGNVGASAESTLLLGAGGAGFLTVTTGGLLAGTAMDIAMGGAGGGTLTVNSGGDVLVDAVSIGNSANTDPLSAAMITGAGSALVGSTVTVGKSGGGTLRVSAGGAVESTTGVIGDLAGSGGLAIIEHAGSRWTTSGDLFVGGSGNAGLLITSGGRVTSESSWIGADAGSTSEATVTGEDSEWSSEFGLSVGAQGTGTLNITDGGYVEDGTGLIGLANGAVGTVTVEGIGSRWITSEKLYIGRDGQGTVNILAGALVDSILGIVGGEGSGVVNVSGTNARWSSPLGLSIGGEFDHGSGHGTLNVTNGGRVAAGSISIAGHSGSTGTAAIGGNNSTLTSQGRLFIGVGSGTSGGGAGTLRIQPGGTVDISLETVLGDGDELHLEGGTLRTSEIDFLGLSEPFFWTSGTLHVGIYHGNLTAPNGGILVPGNSPGTTVVQGNYNHQPGATLEIEIAGVAPGSQHDQLNVQGVSTLAGNLQLEMLNGFIPASDDTFTILQSSIIAGALGNVASGQRLKSSDGVGSFVVDYGPGSPFVSRFVVLSAYLPVLPGDYNFNGIVDAADYTVWRDTLGTTGVALPADGNNDGQVNLDDYAFWKAHFGETPGSGSDARANSAVPEPAALVLLMIAVAGWSLRQGRAA